MYMYVVHTCTCNLQYIHLRIRVCLNCHSVISSQNKYILAASNDFAARIWTVGDQRPRVSSSVAIVTYYYEPVVIFSTH